MKKYFMTMAVLTIFAIGFAASDEDSSDSSISNSKPQVEEKQETEAERYEREQKEREEKKQELAKDAYDSGYHTGFTFTSAQYYSANKEGLARKNYTTWHGVPKTDEEKELYNIYIENYVKGMEDGYNAQ